MRKPNDETLQSPGMIETTHRSVDRRRFLKLSGLGAMGLFAAKQGVMAGPFTAEDFKKFVPADKKLGAGWIKSLMERGEPTFYKSDDLKYIGMPIGGIGAGQLYLGGDGKLWHWDIFNENINTGTSGPHYANPPKAESSLKQGFALTIDGKTRELDRTGFSDIRFRGEYPIGRVEYRADDVAVNLEAFSPFIPLNTDDSSLPATVMSFTVKNTGSKEMEATLVGALENIIASSASGIRRTQISTGKSHSFMMCSVEKIELVEGEKKPDVVFEDWNKETYEGWEVQGTAFGNGPPKRTDLGSALGDPGGDTERVVNSYATAPGSGNQKDAAKGRLTSRPFKIDRQFITVFMGGGKHRGKTCVNLLVNGRVERSVLGPDSTKFKLMSMPVPDLMGKTAVLEIVDESQSASWGHVGVGKITFTDETPENFNQDGMEQLADFGSMGIALLGNPPEVSDTESALGMIGRKMKLAPGATQTVTFVLTWYFPNLRMDKLSGGRYYATKFDSAKAVADYVAENFPRLSTQTRLWRDTWYDSTLPYWFLDRALIPVSCLASSTCYRFKDGRFYAWEGVGCCEGTCGHVWYYAQAAARLFPEIERDTRERVDFGLAQKPDGSIPFRGEMNNHPAVDSQAGCVLRAYREHQMTADSAFLKRNWKNIKRALEWLMNKDTNSDGILEGPQHNTLDQDWFGEVAWLSGVYLAALRAGGAMAIELGEPEFAEKCAAIFKAGRKSIVDRLFNGEYFIQVGHPDHLKTVGTYDGCHIDQVLGQSWAYQVGLGEVLPREQTRTALKTLWTCNFTPDVGPYRKAYPAGRWYAMAGEAGTLMCSWPKGDAKRVTTGYDYYFNECMNGFEYQLASHMIWENMLLEGMAITRAVHDRYDASRRNPWNEVECGDHYARSMASYGVFTAACGFEYHGPKGHIGFAPRIGPAAFKAPFTAAEGWGNYEQQVKAANLKSRITLRYGKLRLKTISLGLPDGMKPKSAKVTLKGTDLANQLQIREGKAFITLSANAVIDTDSALELIVQ